MPRDLIGLEHMRLELLLLEKQLLHHLLADVNAIDNRVFLRALLV